MSKAVPRAAGETQRVCGSCTICCRLVGVPETGKPAGRWCPDCTACGCAIHPTRPQSCRNFECFWLMDEDFPEDLRPDRCGFVVYFNADRESVIIHLAPERPDALAEPPGAEMLAALLSAFEHVFIVCGEERLAVRRSADEEAAAAPQLRDAIAETTAERRRAGRNRPPPRRPARRRRRP